MQAFIYEILSASCFGISNAYWKKIDKAGYSFEEAIFYRGIMGFTFLLLLWGCLQFTGQLSTITYLAKNILLDFKWLYTLLICLFCSFGLVCYVASLQYKTIAVAVSLSSINVFGILTAVIFFNEAFQEKHLFSLIIATVGILLISLQFNKKKRIIDFNLKSILLPLLAAFFWGVGYTLFKIPLQWMGALTLGLVIESTVLFVAFILLLKRNKLHFIGMIIALTKTPHFFIAGLLLMMGSLFVNIALTKLSIVSINILGLFTFPVSIVSAFIFNKENPKLKEWVGIILIISSIIFLILIK